MNQRISVREQFAQQSHTDKFDLLRPQALYWSTPYCHCCLCSSRIHQCRPLEPVQSLPEISDHMEMRARYPSDISREQFEQIRALLEGARKK
ncbi:hypothetical protein LYZ88_22150, partial [Xanthomonas hortorum pv. vitians]|nr:hypothetical protein [Xanthomonas hortorum pv. vitians]MCE4522388.1 hypothetical protein [Xanthomonas hortorum pv. vitians]